MALADALDPAALAAAEAEGLVARTTAGGIATTRTGRLRLDALLPRLVR